jgi:hypothetical protein
MIIKITKFKIPLMTKNNKLDRNLINNRKKRNILREISLMNSNRKEMI